MVNKKGYSWEQMEYRQNSKYIFKNMEIYVDKEILMQDYAYSYLQKYEQYAAICHM